MFAVASDSESDDADVSDDNGNDADDRDDIGDDADDSDDNYDGVGGGDVIMHCTIKANEVLFFFLLPFYSFHSSSFQ
jgi:hypothetical protein